ncbi:MULTISPECIES: hypothetical protein [Halomicrobium]|nr:MULTISPECIES: hypothetical protein [Halomicrobium]QCD65431.1 hypothetical protein E5139_07190 [Halomicrobium mukohataei]QFR20237.1 hypothetical protein GBQ70_07185 [Halomicrobium sp. ZPS1]
MTVSLSRLDSSHTRSALRFGLPYGTVGGIVMTAQATRDPVATFVASPLGMSVLSLLHILLLVEIAALVGYLWTKYSLVAPVVVIVILSFSIVQPDRLSPGVSYVRNLFSLLAALGLMTALGVAEYVLRSVTGSPMAGQ